MSTTLEIFLIIFIFVLIIISILAYSKLTKFLDSLRVNISTLTGTVDKLASDVTDVKEKLMDLTENADKIIVNANDIVGEVKVQTMRVSQSIDPFVSLINGFYHRVASPVRQTAGVLSGAAKAINHFFARVSE